MKKFLFTLAALLMTTGSIYAEEYLYVEDFEVAADELGTEIDVTVKAHFDARVSAFDLEVVAPEGMVPVWSENGADCHIAYYNGRGKVAYCDASIGTLDYYNYVAITSATIVSYWQNPETGAWESALSVKWEPGDYDEMMIITFEIAEDFKGGNLTLITKPACGEDPRGNICEKNQVNERTAVVTVEGGEEPPVEPKDLTGEITVSEPDELGYVEIGYTGDEEVAMAVVINGEPAEAPYQLAEGENTIVVTVTADGYNPMEETFTVTYTPVVAPKDLEGEIVVSEPTEEGTVIVSYSGNEIVTITVNGEEYDGDPIQLEEGTNELVVVVEAEGYNPLEDTFVIEWTKPEPPQPMELTGEVVVGEPNDDGIVTVEYTGEEEVTVTVTINGEPAEEPYQLAEGENTIVVTVTADGYEPIEETFTVTYTAPVTPPEPEVTPVPVVTFEITDDAYIFTATGEGEVVLYVNGEAVDNPYSVARPEAGEEPIAVSVYATAKDGDKEMSQCDPIEMNVEPKAGEVSEGIELVLIDQFGEEHHVALNVGEDNDVSTTVTLDYYPYGQFQWNPNLTTEENEANRPAVPFYFIINGEVYGAEDGNVATVLGYAMQNPLTEEGEGYYTVPVGYSYTLGVAFKDGVYYVYAAVSTQVGVDELNANKTVAGVRYFNMAGQEMQEANGMTIVVTTYTDGTTSAAKVIK